MVVAWRIAHLTKLGREVPEVPCTVYFEEAQWQALVAFVTGKPPPAQPPTLREAVRMEATRLDGLLGREGDGEPGALREERDSDPGGLDGLTSSQTSEQLGYGDPSNGEFKSLAVVLCFLRFLLCSPQKATKRTKKKGIGSARLEGPFGHFF
jgi:hypothetical protein